MADRKILYVDDNAEMLERVARRLSSEGLEVETTTSTVGLARLLPGVVLVLLDYHMPGLNGGDVLNSLRSASRHLPTPPAFYLYSASEVAQDQMHQLGFDGAFAHKGDLDHLVTQLMPVYRLLSLRALRKRVS